MTATTTENRLNSSEREANGTDLPSIARRYIASLNSDRARALGAEGEAILGIVEPFELQEDLRAAVLVYPLVRDGIVDAAALAEGSLGRLSTSLEGLVQLGQFSLPDDWQPGEALATQQSDALRKMLLAVVSDPRLVLVRIAEQLHKLRDAKAEPERQHRLALETSEIYAPLANRLGVWQLKWELEDLAFRFLEPETYMRIARLLKEKRVERERFIAEVGKTLENELAAAGIEAEVSGRPKHIYSIWRKMQRKDRGLEQIFDVRAVRVFVRDVAQCYAALGIVHHLWPYLPGEFDDYIANPKENNYQSLHTAVIGPGGKTLEVQIRTRDMHRHAELGVAAHWRYKEGAAPEGAFDQKIRFLRQMLEPSERDSDLLDQIRDDVLEDRVYAVTPKGDVVDLPMGATPLDFAYHVHTQVGHRCRGAKVNGRIVPLTYRIRNGDKIEIITGATPQPSRDWLSPRLGYLAASRSRTKVRNWFREQDKDQNLRQGREIIERELGRLNVKDQPLEAVARALKYPDLDSLCVALGAGDVTAASVASAIQQLRNDSPEAPLRKRRHAPKKAGASDQIAVLGVGDLMCNFARCCRPVPPEPIVGYITQLRGVSIHREDCGNLRGLAGRHPERLIEVSWGESDDSYYSADLTIHAYDRQGLLRDISNVMSDEHVSIDSVDTRSDKRQLQAVMNLTVSVPNLPALSRVMSRLESLPNVTAVRRNA
jgi:GTP pyrophosphokinase